jgi:cell division protein FtsX
LTERRGALVAAIRLAAARPASCALVVLLVAASACALALGLAFTRTAVQAAQASGVGPEVSVFVRPGVSPTDLDALRARLAAADGVRSVRLIPREQAFAELGKRAGLNLEGRANPLPDVLVARIELLGDPGRIDALAAAARAWPGVDAVRADNEGYRRLALVVAPVGEVGRAVAALALLVASVAISLALAVLVRPDQREASVLLLAGATRRAVVRPCAYLGALAVGAGAALGLAAAIGAQVWLEPRWSAVGTLWGGAVALHGASAPALAVAVAVAMLAGGFVASLMSRRQLSGL